MKQMPVSLLFLQDNGQFLILLTGCKIPLATLTGKICVLLSSVQEWLFGYF